MMLRADMEKKERLEEAGYSYQVSWRHCAVLLRSARRWRMYRRSRLLALALVGAWAHGLRLL